MCADVSAFPTVNSSLRSLYLTVPCLVEERDLPSESPSDNIFERSISTKKNQQ